MRLLHFFAKIHDTKEGNNPLYVATKEGITYEGVNCLPVMSIPSQLAQKSDPQKHTASVSNISFEMLNTSGYDISIFVYKRLNSRTKMFYGEKVEIFSINETGVVKRLYVGIIENIDNDTYEGKYTVELSSITSVLKGIVFDRETSDYQIDGVYETAEQRNATRMPPGFTCYHQVSSEDPEETSWLVVFEGTPRQCFEGILSALMSTPEVRIGAGYLDARWQDFVDLKSLDNLNAPEKLYFEFREGITDPLEFLRNQVYKAANVYPCVTHDNLYRLKKYIQPTADLIKDTVEINEANTLSVGSKGLDKGNMANHIKVNSLKMWKNPLDKNDNINYDFKETKYFMDRDSFAKYKKVIPDEPVHFELEGLNRTLNRPAVITSIVAAYFSRWALPTTFVELDVPVELFFTLATGDYVRLRNKFLIAWKGEFEGTPGLDYVNDDPDSPEFSDPASVFNEGMRWDMFVPGNTLGVDSRGTFIVDTTNSEIRHEIFNGPSGSCTKNRELVSSWISYQNS